MRKDTFLKRLGTALKQMRAERLAEATVPEHSYNWDVPGTNERDPDSMFAARGRQEIADRKAAAANQRHRFSGPAENDEPLPPPTGRQW